MTEEAADARRKARPWLEIVFLAAVVLAPLPIGANRPWLWPILTLLFGGLLIAWGIAVGRERRPVAVPYRQFRGPGLLFLAALAWAALQTVPAVPPGWAHPLWAEVAALLPDMTVVPTISLDPETTRAQAGRLLGYAVVFFLAAQLGRDREGAVRLFRTLVVAGLVYAAYGISLELAGVERVLWMEKTSYVGTVTSTFINRNHYATFVGLCLVVSLGLLVQAGRRELRSLPEARLLHVHLAVALVERHAWLLVSVATEILALGMTQSRAGLLSGVVGVLVLSWLVARSYGTGPTGRWLIRGGIALAVVVVAMSGQKTLDRIGDTSLAGGIRDELYLMCLRAIANNPWLGYGLGSFTEVAELYREPDLPGHLQYDYAHNTYLELWLDLGLLAGSALMLAVVTIAWRCLRGVFERQRDAILPAIAVAATAVVAVHSLFDFSLQIPAVATVYAAILGTGFAQSWSTRSD